MGSMECFKYMPRKKRRVAPCLYIAMPYSSMAIHGHAVGPPPARQRQIDRQTDRQTDRQAGRQRQTDRQTGRQADRDRHTDRQADR